MTDLAAWLLDCIAEDERRIRSAGDPPDGEYAWLTYRDPDGSMRYTTVAHGYAEADLWIVDGKEAHGYESAHVFLDPARVLAECESKKRIVELHQNAIKAPLSPPCCGVCVDKVDRYDWEPESYPCPTLRALALPFADRPGFREEWR